MRYYQIEGKHYPSVTTILSATKPKATEDALERWKNRIGVDVAKDKFLSACARGTAMHNLCEAHLLNRELGEITDHVKPYWESIKPTLSQITNVQMTEQRVHHPKLKYAGCLDAYATFRGVENTLIDFKSSDKKKDSKWITDYFLQVVAYSAAVKELFDISTNQAAIIIGVPNHKAQVFVLTRELMLVYWQLWKNRVKQFYSKSYDDSLKVLVE